jgi:hypothetical protein
MVRSVDDNSVERSATAGSKLYPFDLLVEKMTTVDVGMEEDHQLSGHAILDNGHQGVFRTRGK